METDEALVPDDAGVTENGVLWERSGKTVHLVLPPLPPGDWVAGPLVRFEVDGSQT